MIKRGNSGWSTLWGLLQEDSCSAEEASMLWGCFGVAMCCDMSGVVPINAIPCNSQTWDIKAGSTGSTKREKWHHFENLKETQRSQRDFSFICFPSPFSFPHIPTIPIHSHSHPPYPHPHPHSFPIPNSSSTDFLPLKAGEGETLGTLLFSERLHRRPGTQKMSPRAAWGPPTYPNCLGGFRWIFYDFLLIFYWYCRIFMDQIRLSLVVVCCTTKAIWDFCDP